MDALTFFYNGRQVLKKQLDEDEITIGGTDKSDFVLKSNKIEEEQLVISRNTAGEWVSCLKGVSLGENIIKSVDDNQLFSLGEFDIKFSLGKKTPLLPRLTHNNTGDDFNKYNDLIGPFGMGIIGGGKMMTDIKKQILQIAPLKASVLVTGESGTGKELVARAIHQHGKHSDGPFVEVNCGGLTPSLIEDIFFGHAKGAFTGAINEFKGVFEQADGGTLFLDEIGELPLEHQSALLRVLETFTVKRVGGNRSYSVNFRVIAATNRDLQTMLSKGGFRLDLYHRISVFDIKIPPLRERMDDLPLLCTSFLEATRSELGYKEIGADGMDKLEAYFFPGNVRELKNILYRAAALSGDKVIDKKSIYLNFIDFCKANKYSLTQLKIALKKYDGNISKAARSLGIPRSSFRKRLQEG